MKNSRFGILIITVLVVLAIGLAVFGPMILRKRAARVPPDIQEFTSSAVTAKGLVESEDERVISSEIVGSISEIAADEGDSITRGQLLIALNSDKIVTKVRLSEAMVRESAARLRELETGFRQEDVEAAQSRADRAEAVYIKAKDEFERQKRLYEKDAATLVELDRAEEMIKTTEAELKEARSDSAKYTAGARPEEIEQAKAQVDRSNAELAYHKAVMKDFKLYAPFDGIVTERFKEPAETVDIGTPILKIIDPGKLRVRAELEETDVGKVTEGQAVEVYVDAYKDRIFRGKVDRVLPALKRYSLRAFDPMASFDVNAQDIYVRLDDFSGLKNAMTVTVRFLK